MSDIPEALKALAVAHRHRPVTEFIDALLDEFLVVPRRYLGREELRTVPFGTLVERDDGQVWLRVDALLTSWIPVWPDDDDSPSRPVYPARVIWQPPAAPIELPEDGWC